ncbi:MAG: type II toxin-antitoxin system RelE/ParE family toxin [Candidatus Latescibacterota bacterium]|jgi:putative addiction module killer protein
MAEATPKKLEEYLTADGQSPFIEWFDKIRDAPARARIRVRLDRLSLGNFGDSKSVGGVVHELRLDYGPGSRVYFAQHGHQIILLLWGGTKCTQQQGIQLAQEYWNDFRSRIS